MMPNEVASPHGFKINQLSYLLDWGLARVTTNAKLTLLSEDEDC